VTAAKSGEIDSKSKFRRIAGREIERATAEVTMYEGATASMRPGRSRELYLKLLAERRRELATAAAVNAAILANEAELRASSYKKWQTAESRGQSILNDIAALPGFSSSSTAR
jgi:hypothetical protein